MRVGQRTKTPLEFSCLKVEFKERPIKLSTAHLNPPGLSYLQLFLTSPKARTYGQRI
jgi:hypothetical protein